MSKLIQVANCRGKDKMLTDVKRALRLLAMVECEMNFCALRDAIAKARGRIGKILIKDNPNIKIYKK